MPDPIAFLSGIAARHDPPLWLHPKPYRCKLCGRRFALQKGYSNHIAAKHRGEMLIPSRARRLAEAQNWRCCYCGCVMSDRLLLPDTATIEHLVPKSRRGRNVDGNLVAACFDCNTRRGVSDPIAFWHSEQIDHAIPRSARRVDDG